MAHIILSLPQCHSRGYTQDKFISMYHRLFSHGNAGWVGNPTQNLASSVAEHKLENLLAANAVHGRKLVALILSFPESQRDKGSPEPPEPAVPTMRHVGVLCLRVQLDVACNAPCIAPVIILHNVRTSQNWFYPKLNSISLNSLLH